MQLLGSIIYITSYFLQICFLGSLLSTLDSLLFCIFILTQVRKVFKMGCSIRKCAKYRVKCGWTKTCLVWYDIYVGRLPWGVRPILFLDWNQQEIEALFVSSEHLVFFPLCGSQNEIKCENLRKFGSLDFSHRDTSYNCTSWMLQISEKFKQSTQGVPITKLC